MAPRDHRAFTKTPLLSIEQGEKPDMFGPRPGHFAVSVNFERGMSFHTPCPMKLLPQIDPTEFRPAPPLVISPADAYSYFQFFTPRIEPEIGYSILLYDVSLEDANRVRQQQGLPLLPID